MAHIFSIHEDEIEPPRFTIDGEITKQHRRFIAVGTQFAVRLLRPDRDDTNPMFHFFSQCDRYFCQCLTNCSNSDMVGVTIPNEVNVQDKAVGISFRRKDQVSEIVVWSVFEKVAQCNARVNALEKSVVVVHSIKMPVGFGRVKTKGRPLSWHI
jgi:hypothetical protein